jgi:tripartite ATP-independent transporter DctP family solute receptor
MKPVSARASRLSFLLVTSVVVLCIGYAGYSAWKHSRPGAARELRIAHTLPPTHPVHKGLEKFAARLAEVSGGNLSATIFPSGQLGTDTQYVEQLQSGTLDMASVSAGVLGNFVPDLRVFSIPFLFRDRDQRWRALDGGPGRALLHERLRTRGDGRPSGLYGLAFFDSGSRSFYAKEALASPADIRGRKWRVMADPVAMDMVEELGGSPTPIAAAELYSALAQGVVDGAENNPPTFLHQRHYEICSHYLLTEHAAIPDILVMADTLRIRLTAEQKGWIEQAARDAALFQREVWQKESDEAMDALRKAGVTILPADRDAFKELTRPVREAEFNGPGGSLARSLESFP